MSSVIADAVAPINFDCDDIPPLGDGLERAVAMFTHIKNAEECRNYLMMNDRSTSFLIAFKGEKIIMYALRRFGGRVSDDDLLMLRIMLDARKKYAGTH